MSRLLLALWLVLAAWSAKVEAADAGTADTQQVAAFIDEWHDDAAHSRLRFFDKMAPGAIYIGTDKTERWTREELKEWSKKYFERPSAWALIMRAGMVSQALPARCGSMPLMRNMVDG